MRHWIASVHMENEAVNTCRVCSRKDVLAEKKGKQRKDSHIV